MVHVATAWSGHAAAMGSQPGDNQGDVIVYLTCGPELVIRLPSDAVTIAAEAGSVIGVQAVLPDGRRAFWPASSVAAVLDAPADDRHGSG